MWPVRSVQRAGWPSRAERYAKVSARYVAIVAFGMAQITTLLTNTTGRDRDDS